MKQRILFLVTLFSLGLVLNCKKAEQEHKLSISDQAREFLRNRIESAGVPLKIVVGENQIFASVMLPIFYERRGYLPAWSNDEGPQPSVDDLIQSIQEADQEGLRPENYHLSKIVTIIEEIQQNQNKKQPLNPRILIDLDLLLTDAFLIYGSHLLAGRVNPETIHSQWFANRREADLAAVLQNAIETNQISENLQNLLPNQSGYFSLKNAMAKYKRICGQGGWPIIPEGFKMQKGDHDDRVIILRKRLVATDDLKIIFLNDGNFFDNNLETAVRIFQHRHGLDENGMVNKLTLDAFNIPVEERISQIEVNMERWRWLPQDLGRRYIIVNIANFNLNVVEAEKTVIEMRVIVGKTYRRTPVFSDTMTYLVLNPYWHTPPSIAKNDILPMLRKDPNYLSKKNIKVFQYWGAETVEIDPKTIDWSQITAKNLNYRFRQEPGPDNSLGRIKFMFPNQFNVYLHDTPSRELFQKTVRGFSSGCIRIENPIELAEYVLQGNPRWSRTNILAALSSSVEQTVPLPEPIPVHILYWTAWIGEEGILNFCNDIYERDKPLTEALREEFHGI